MLMLNKRILADGAKPIGVWFAEASRVAILRYYARDWVPRVQNGATVVQKADVADFWRYHVRSHFQFHERFSSFEIFHNPDSGDGQRRRDIL